MDDTKPQNSKLPPEAHPNMSPEERLALWHYAQKVWKQPAEEMIAEIERARAEWDRQVPQG